MNESINGSGLDKSKEKDRRETSEDMGSKTRRKKYIVDTGERP